MSLDSRLGRLSPGLSARERVVLYVRAALEGQRIDPSVGATMPNSQVAEANRYVTIANGILHVLLPQALILQADVEALSLRFQLLLTWAAWGTERTRLRNALQLLAVIPIAQTEYDRLVSEGRAEYLPYAEAAELLEVIDERLDGPRDEHGYERELRRLIKAGNVRSRGKGDALEVDVGSIYDYLGKRFEPFAIGAWRYQPVPDSEYARHRWRAEMEATELERVDKGPGMPRFPLAAAEPQASAAMQPADAARDALALRARSDMLSYWSRLLAIEAVRDEAVEQFEDEGVIPESMDSLLARARLGLIDLYEQGMVLLGIDGFPEADAQLLEQLRQALVRDETILL